MQGVSNDKNYYNIKNAACFGIRNKSKQAIKKNEKKDRKRVVMQYCLNKKQGDVQSLFGNH